MMAGAGALALLGLGLGWRYETHGRYIEETNDAQLAADSVAISAKLAGYVREVPVVDNDAVSRRAPLVKIDPVDYATRLDAANADIAAANAAQAAASAEAGQARAAADEAEAGLGEAQVELERAQREEGRYRPLASAGAEPAEKLAQLISNTAHARAEVALRRATLARMRQQVALAQAHGQAATARAQSATTAAHAARNDLDATRLTAPIDGRVASLGVRVGQFVSPGQRLMTLVPDGSLYVVANFKETQLGLMRPGQMAEIRVDALPGVVFHGEVESTSPGTGAQFSLIPPQNATGNFTKIVQRVPVRIRIYAGPVSRRVLVPGLSLSVSVDTSAGKEELAAIRAEQERRGQ